MNRAALIGTLMAALLPSASFAEMNYSKVELQFIDVELDGPFANVDGDGFAISGAYELDDKLFLLGEWQDQNFDFGIDGTQYELGAGERGGTEQEVHVGAEAAAVDQDEPLAALRELIRELHRDPATERMPDEGRALVAQGDHEVAYPARVGPARVVASRLGRAAVAQQIRRDHREALRERRHHALPRLRGRRDAVDEDEHRAAAGRPVDDAVAVELDFPELELRAHLYAAAGAG